MKPAAQSRGVMLEHLARRYAPLAGAGPLRKANRMARLRAHVFLTVISATHLLKRAIDIVGAGVALVAGSPLFLVVAAAVKLQDGGPIFYWQRRVGQGGAEFDFPKFRTMVQDAHRQRSALLHESVHSDSVTFKMRQDPRVTKIGRLLRRSSIDELPQLWCVLRGQMSLVGPRPALPCEVSQYSVSDRRRLQVKPGLTCLWQVMGRGDIPFSGQVLLDAQYIEERCLMMDLVLLLKTIPAVLLGRGAY